jgi:hypothetical protein
LASLLERNRGLRVHLPSNRAEFSVLLEVRGWNPPIARTSRPSSYATLQHSGESLFVAQDERAATVAPIDHRPCRALPASELEIRSPIHAAKIPHIAFSSMQSGDALPSAPMLINLLQWRCRREIRPPQAGRTFSPQSPRTREAGRSAPQHQNSSREFLPTHPAELCEESDGECCRQVLCRHSESQRRCMWRKHDVIFLSSPRNLVSIHHRRREMLRVRLSLLQRPGCAPSTRLCFPGRQPGCVHSFSSRTIFSPPSVDPSFTTINSKSETR